MVRKILGIGLSVLLLTACDLNKEPETQEFITPRDQYGARYSVGDLGGKPVNLGREAPWVEYEDNTGFVTGKKYKRQTRTHQSKIQAFGFDMRYTDGLVLVVYYKASPYSEKQYNAEINLPDNHWVSVSVYADRHYNGDLSTRLINSTLETKISSKKILEEFYFMHIYLPTDEYEYGLQKYVPHPEWVKQNKKLMAKNTGSNALYNIDDLYVEKNETGKVLTLITCGDSEYPIARKCKQEFILEPEMKARVTTIFQKVHLQDWKIIQLKAKKMMLGFIVEPKNFKGV
ncbi:hypothetical protein F941_01067 [Acinetobacter bouvetii DSM 14964 = CIP 107468]|uniref:Lipoprotein n=1 Tax=Acinetobacter bouvetii DSM 14964 = CIP 107468 TaxID=1120925 RepID=N9DL64_9GAMM|nr:hypothetical protein [Acinetobacter bouvetii]ENV83439.1 hypothetical protein F941_01067 [Acinetobacter bouvetii DSM 14964 = CIP 107468]BCU65309.1 hypothetical protein ACBO_21000 [Acinetobacter bouvetii]